MSWKNKKVLVTGADGFIGSHLTEKLVASGARVRAFVYYNSFNHWGWLDTLEPGVLKKIDVFTGDIRDPNGVMQACKDIDVIFHLAALIGIPFSYHSPDSYVDTNIKGTLNILQAAKRWKAQKLIHTSTSEVYGTAQYVPIDENHPINPQSPYAATKSAADSLALSFFRSFDLPVAIVRPFNTFGPRQSARAIIPTVISQIYSGKKVIEVGNVYASRDFNYVENTVNGFLKVAEVKETAGEVFNSGSGQEFTIREMIECVEKITGKRVKLSVDAKRLRPKKSEVERLLCNPKKIQDICGWREVISFQEGLEKTCRWVKSNLKSYKTNIYNV